MCAQVVGVMHIYAARCGKGNTAYLNATRPFMIYSRFDMMRSEMAVIFRKFPYI